MFDENNYQLFYESRYRFVRIFQFEVQLVEWNIDFV
jgi:hypothetical protein